MKNKLLALILVISILLLAGCSAAITSNESAILYESYESDAQKQEMLQLKYNENSSAFYANETRDIEGKALYVLLQYEISPRIFKYTAADFGITDESKIKEIKDLGIDEWKYDPYELGEAFEIHRELQIILNESNKDYLFELAKKVYELPFVYGVSVDYEEGPYTDYNIEEEICQTIIKKDFPDFENKEKAKQYMMQREYSNEKNLNIPKENNIICKEIYIFLMHEISLCEYEYTAADFGITDVSKIKEIKNDTIGDKTDSYYRQEVNIILNEISTTDAKTLAQKIYNLSFVEQVTLEYDFKKLPIAIESVEVETPSLIGISADEIFLNFAKKQSIKSDTAKNPIIVKITSLSQLEEFVDGYKSGYPEENTTKFEETSFAKKAAEYNREFFENNTLFVTYLFAPRLCDTHAVTGGEIKSNEFKVQISEIISVGEGPDEERQTIMFFEQPKEKVDAITKISVTQVQESIFGVKQIN